jgi:hypothetical protein
LRIDLLKINSQGEKKTARIDEELVAASSDKESVSVKNHILLQRVLASAGGRIINKNNQL